MQPQKPNVRVTVTDAGILVESDGSVKVELVDERQKSAWTVRRAEPETPEQVKHRWASVTGARVVDPDPTEEEIREAILKAKEALTDDYVPTLPRAGGLSGAVLADGRQPSPASPQGSSEKPFWGESWRTGTNRMDDGEKR